MATVTGIELRGPDIAVLTLQPEQPLNYFPGQHISVQTPHWPRCGAPTRSRTPRKPTGCSALQEMELLYPWLQVILAVSDEPAHDHGTMYGTVPELAAKATWADREIYISGPDHIIVKTARVLRERGAPDHLIHYDLDPKASGPLAG
jgi:NAD(P)H-flavin reductase